jgi:hypothetical protein
VASRARICRTTSSSAGFDLPIVIRDLFSQDCCKRMTSGVSLQVNAPQLDALRSCRVRASRVFQVRNLPRMRASVNANETYSLAYYH